MTKKEAIDKLKPIGDNLVTRDICDFLDSDVNLDTRTVEVNNTASIMWDHPTYVEPAETHESARGPYDGWIDSVSVDGKKYAIRAAVVEYHALTCPKCGGQIHMHNGMGKCQFCDTEFSATIRLVEV